MSKYNDKIIKRIYVKGEINLMSPLALGSGEDNNSESDIMRDWEGIPFIPGSSLAGSARAYLESIIQVDSDKIIDTIFGGNGDNSCSSLITFHDAVLNVKKMEKLISIRDGVKIDRETKTSEDKKKFDYEIIDRGNKFTFMAEVIIRDKHIDELSKIENVLYLLLNAFAENKISIGAKTRRGFGEIKMKAINVLILDMLKDADKWIDFSWDGGLMAKAGSIEQLKHDDLMLTISPQSAVVIEAFFEIPYSMIIRSYSVEPEKTDASHLKSGNINVIPGTSWSGALSQAIYNVGKELQRNQSEKLGKNFFGEIEKIRKDLFGFVDEGRQQGKRNRPKASGLLIRESEIKNGKDIPYTRIKIDRFTGGTVEGALFTEKPVYGGEVTLKMIIREAKESEIGLLILAIKEIGNGFSTVGGEANIGRGILFLKDLKIDNNIQNENTYIEALAKAVNENEVTK